MKAKEKIKARAAEMGLKMRVLAKGAGVHPTTLSRWGYTIPYERTNQASLRSVARQLKVTVAWLTNDSLGYPPPPEHDLAALESAMPDSPAEELAGLSDEALVEARRVGLSAVQRYDRELERRLRERRA